MGQDSIVTVAFKPGGVSVALFDLVADRYRFIATAKRWFTPSSPPPIALQQAIVELELMTGETLMAGKSGGTEGAAMERVGTRLVTASGVRPLMVAVIGTRREGSTASCLLVLDGLYADAAGTLSLDDKNLKSPVALYQRIAELHLMTADAILIATEDDKAARESLGSLLTALAAAAPDSPEEGPVIVYAGKPEGVEELKSRLEGRLVVETVADLLPAPSTENLEPARQALADLWRTRVLPNIPFLRDLNGFSTSPIRWRSEGLVLAARLLASWQSRSAVLIDSEHFSLGLVVAQDKGSLYNYVLRDLAHDDWGLGQFQRNLKEIQRLLPFEIATSDGANIVNNRARPWRVVDSERDYLLGAALAEVEARRVLTEPRFGLASAISKPGQFALIGTGRMIREAPSLGHAVLFCLDACPIGGVVDVLLDPLDLASSLGALVYSQLPVAADLLINDVLEHVATCFVAQGRGRGMRLSVAYDDGSQVRMAVPYGSIEALPLPPGRKARIQAQPIGDLDLGWGRGKGGTVEVEGSSLGIVADCRGRPVVTPGNLARRQSAIERWLFSLGVARQPAPAERRS